MLVTLTARQLKVKVCNFSSSLVEYKNYGSNSVIYVSKQEIPPSPGWLTMALFSLSYVVVGCMSSMSAMSLSLGLGGMVAAELEQEARLEVRPDTTPELSLPTMSSSSSRWPLQESDFQTQFDLMSLQLPCWQLSPPENWTDCSEILQCEFQIKYPMSVMALALDHSLEICKFREILPTFLLNTLLLKVSLCFSNSSI